MQKAVFHKCVAAPHGRLMRATILSASPGVWHLCCGACIMGKLFEKQDLQECGG